MLNSLRLKIQFKTHIRHSIIGGNINNNFSKTRCAAMFYEQWIGVALKYHHCAKELLNA